MSVIAVLIGGIGIFTANNEEAEIRDMYEHVVLPMREVARIRRLVVDNAGQMFRAFQHNPAVEYSKLHEHPISEHLDLITKNLAWMDETFASLHQHLPEGTEETRLLQEIEVSYKKYVDSVMQPTMTAMLAGNYSQETVSTFLKGNRAFEKTLNPMMKNLAETQEKTAKAGYELALEQSRKALQNSIILIVVSVGCGLFFGLNIIISITRPLNEMQTAMLRAANEDDFTGEVVVKSTDEIGATATAFNGLMGTLRKTLGEIRGNTIQIDDATGSLENAAKQAAIASNDSSESASSMAASIEQMSVSISSVSESTREALEVAKTAGKHSETGGVVISNAIQDMENIAQQVRNVGATISILGEQSDKISAIVQVIKDVADQTNLLALNAAIEAARAGEAGRGFAVVADEVRKLAERTTKATGEIGQMISAIQDTSSQAVNSMDTTIDSLQRGSGQAATAGQAILAIQESNQRVVEVMNDINNAMGEQGAASLSIAQRVEKVAQAAEENSTTVGVTADTAQDIHRFSRAMRSNVERFRI
jgi:methyl-accepting chemotaxis protein